MRDVRRRALLQSMLTAALVPPRGWTIEAPSGERAKELTAMVYELRVYHVTAGKMGDLLARFRDHTEKLFERHGMKSLAYWNPVDEPEKSNTLIYILQHPSRAAAAANWKAFQDDPEWKSVKEKSEANGKLTEKIDSTFLQLTDFSPSLK
jgi:NIPSNAP